MHTVESRPPDRITNCWFMGRRAVVRSARPRRRWSPTGATLERQAGVLEQLPHPVGDELGGRVVEDLIEITMIEAGQHLALDDIVHLVEVDDDAALVERSRQRHLQR